MEPPADGKSLREIIPVIRQILRQGEVAFSSGALANMKEDGLSELDCINALRGGRVAGQEVQGDKVRYRITTRRLVVVAALRSEQALWVVSARRLRS